MKRRDWSSEIFLGLLSLGTIGASVGLVKTGDSSFLWFFGVLWVVFGSPVLWDYFKKWRRGDSLKSYHYRRGTWHPLGVADRYGDEHKAERAKYADAIRLDGGTCMERKCVMPTRYIEPGAPWHLAHDHRRKGGAAYLGPAHPECNEAEARKRGVNW